MKIFISQLNYHIGNFESNRNKIINSISNAKKENSDLIIFSELAVCGYPPRDFLEYPEFIKNCQSTLLYIAEYCDTIGCIIGCPSVNRNSKGKKLYNSAYLLFEGKIKTVRHKTLLPTYDIFDEYRYFEPNHVFQVVDFKGVKIALTICEDIWNVFPFSLYAVSPMDELISQNPDLIINISASPFDFEHQLLRKEIILANVNKYKIPLIYVNHIGAQTELIFDGGSLVYNKNGNIYKEMKYFEEDTFSFNLNELSNSFPEKEHQYSEKSKYELVFNALKLGIQDYFQKQNFKKAIVGLSGGIDSAVVLVLLVESLGAENVLSVLMPSKFSTEHSISDALLLVNNLEVKHEIISIQNIVDEYEKTLHLYFDKKPRNVAEENLQARSRAALLLALSNKFGYILINTSNKSEIATGYGTLYGDMCGGISVLGDLYKTEVYELVNYINRNSKIIPEEIIKKAPSAELKPNQKDSDTLPEYEILDKILYQYIEQNKGSEEIINSGIEKEIVHRTLKMVNYNEYKRYQTPPVLRVSKKAFGIGRRMPIVGKY